jgi:oxygen-independent coproporphyrinogen III oxidase
VRRHTRLGPGAEITIEANPGTVERRKARHLRSLGVNRISLGVQSFHDGTLARLGRVHTGDQAAGALSLLREEGFTNIAADLIYGLPGQTAALWEEDLERLLAFRPEHLSLYALSVEAGTPFGRELGRGKLNLPAETSVVAMYRLARRRAAAAGYEHYEISNWALPGRRSRHNSLYWTGGEYRGVGAGAHSFFIVPKPVRLANVRDAAAYVRRLREGKSPVVMREVLPRRTFLAEQVMLGLRLREGIGRRDFEKRWGVDPLEAFGPGLAGAFGRRWLTARGDRLKLTAAGVLFSNEVFAALF